MLTGKLKVLKQDLKRWNKEVFRHLNTKSKILLHQLCFVEEKELEGDAYGDIKERKRGVTTELKAPTQQRKMQMYISIVLEYFMDLFRCGKPVAEGVFLIFFYASTID